MRNTIYFKGIRLWVQGLLLFALRWAQLKSGFDPVTGLAQTSVPGIILVAAILCLAAAELFLAWKIPGGKRSYINCFAPMGQKSLPLLAAGSLILCAGGILLPGWTALPVAVAVAGAAAAVGLILFAKQVRGGEAKTFPLLPAMLFSVLFVLAVYLPVDCSPVLESYYLPVLAAALIACAFYQLAGLPCREGSLRWFAFLGDMAVPLCLAALADSIGNWGQALAFAGSAMILTVFLSLRRDEPLPETEPEETNDASAPAAAE